MVRPNVILLICHDIGKELGCYGKPVSTPNLDRLAEGGVRFDRHFCNSPPCSPSRSCMVTGRYAHETGAVGLAHFGWPLPEGVRTVVDHLNDGGYETALVGHQHERRPGEGRYQSELNPVGGRKIEDAVDTALDYLKGRAGSERPFYLNIGCMETHASQWGGQDDSKVPRRKVYGSTPDDEVHMMPYLPESKELREQMGYFQACIRHYDREVGRFLDAVEGMGLLKDTVVICTTDHGIANERAKGFLYDAGVEIMLLVRLPDAYGAERGRKVGFLTQNMDVAPTILEAAGLPVPAEMRGRSLWPLLLGGDYVRHDRIFMERNYHDDYDPMRSVRTERFHYIRSMREGAERQWLPHEVPYMNETFVSWHNELWPDCRPPRPREELFDVTADPDEFNDLSGDPAYDVVRAELAEKVERWMRETGDPVLGHGQGLIEAHRREFGAFRDEFYKGGMDFPVYLEWLEENRDRVGPPR
ncbi:MAG: sulfatase [Oscillospiraceae bacterium]|nr:sulfatase [Oscillospiraceae bacterium]